MYTFEAWSWWTQVLKTIYVQVIFTHIWTCSHVVSAIMVQYDVHLIIIYKQFFCVRIRCHVPSKYKPDLQQYNFLSEFYRIINIVIVLIKKESHECYDLVLSLHLGQLSWIIKGVSRIQTESPSLLFTSLKCLEEIFHTYFSHVLAFGEKIWIFDAVLRKNQQSIVFRTCY